MKTLGDVRPDVGRRPLSNLHELLTKESEFSDIDLVRNFQLLPYQIKLLNKTTLMDLIFVGSKENLTANITTLAYITERLVRQVDRLYVYYKSKEVRKEFNITFEEIYESANLTKDGFLSSKFSVIENIRKQMYVKRYVSNLQMYRETLLTYKLGLSVMFNISQIKKNLNKPADDLKKLDQKSLKQILVKPNQQLFTKMLSIRNISSFFEISLEKLKNMTVGNVLTEYLNIKLTTFASLHELTGREIDIVKMKKISTVPYPDDQNLYGLVMKMLEAHGKYYLSHFLVKVLPLVQLKYSISMVWLEIEINLNFFRALSNKTKCNNCSVSDKNSTYIYLAKFSICKPGSPSLYANIVTFPVTFPLFNNYSPKAR